MCFGEISGNDYFCESGTSSPIFQLYPDDLLWDGEGCGGDEGPCNFPRPGIPWFHKILNSSTTDYIELRVNLLLVKILQLVCMNYINQRIID